MTISTVPNKPREGRSSRSVRIDDDDWNDLGDVADSMDLDRGWIVRQLVRWYLGRPGAEQPPRPRSVRK
jgi:hypothetical protein